MTIQMKATEHNFYVVLFISINKMVLTFKSVDEIRKCNHSVESYWAVLSCGTVYYAVQGGSNFKVCAVLSCGTVYINKQGGSNF